MNILSPEDSFEVKTSPALLMGVRLKPTTRPFQ
jgi:hypothetical protein